MDAPNGHYDPRLLAGATARVPDVALARAVGESLERYSGACYNADTVTVATCYELGPRATDPRRFLAFHPIQTGSPDYPYIAATKDSRLGWNEAFSLTCNEPALVPATMVHLYYKALTSHDHFEVCPLSGYACGNTLEEAILRGILEVVERDAFMLFWYQRLPPPAIDLTTLSASEAFATLRRYDGTLVHLFCWDITTDVGIPVALCALTSTQPGWPATTVAMSSDLSMETAIAEALQELAANLRLVSSDLKCPRRPIPRVPGEVITMEDHGLFYASPRNLSALDHLLRPRAWVRAGASSLVASDNVKANIELCVDRLAACGMEVIVVDITPPEVELHGFKVVKVLTPGMRPIDFGVHWPHLGGRRLYEAPLRMGYENVARHPDQLNRFPHPFP